MKKFKNPKDMSLKELQDWREWATEELEQYQDLINELQKWIDKKT